MAPMASRRSFGWWKSLALTVASCTGCTLCEAAVRMTVSGQSAGGSMAMQHLFAFSSRVDGATIAAGSPYGCGALPNRRHHCYYGNVDVKASIEYAYQRFQDGLIDDPANLKQTPMVLFNGRNDYEVYVETMKDAYLQLVAFASPTQIETNFRTNAAHVWSLDHGYCSCGVCGYYSASLECCDVNDCNYDLSGDSIQRFYGSQGSVKPRVMAKRELHWINQWQYIPEGNGNLTWHRSGLSEWAYAYVPTSCEGNVQQCRVHVNYHGCIYKDLFRRRLWATSINLNEYAESNEIIVLYPQAAGTEHSGVGCWNWGFSHDDPYFDTRQSVQLRTVMNMVDDLENALSNASKVANADGHLDQLPVEPANGSARVFV